ncbi:hypothetical protein [Halorussus caseinilyticus]|uniref:hypothetical protein n=1 Tax=Halorussus caseinilyticus TaxID=3034025 RepID=UPI0023E8D75E|nr:hypothetical protein [Halorussus sp. DT72]
MPHEENVTYAVRGRVFDVRGHELALALSLNGANRTLNLSVNTTPGAIGTFETNVTLSRQVNRITVAATDPNRRWSPEYGGDNRTVGRDVLRLDGDGLPDFYELNVTGTDPLGPDSNASRTSFNESGNNVTDGAEDFDNDGETAAQAYWFDLDPLDNDTDGDRLRDGFELQFSGIDPLSPDTDNDTVRDSAEDLDNDSLSNRREQTAGTNPVENDTDSDTLGDAEELANGTDPLSPDTDSDGLTDPNEYELGTDPTVADTDGDGVLDGDETFSTTTENESVGASVNVTADGTTAATVTIQNETDDRIQTGTVANASASEVLDVDADAEFEEANLSIDYDEQAVGDESDLAVYTYDPELQTYVKLPSEVDAENDSVTGTTPHFSTFVAMNQTAWQNYMQSRAKPLPKYALNESFSDLSGWNCTGRVRRVVAEQSSDRNSSALNRLVTKLWHANSGLEPNVTPPPTARSAHRPLDQTQRRLNHRKQRRLTTPALLQPTPNPNPTRRRTSGPRNSLNPSRFRRTRSKSRSRCRLWRSPKSRTRAWKSWCRSGPRPGPSLSCRVKTASAPPTTSTLTRRSRTPADNTCPYGFVRKTSPVRVRHLRTSNSNATATATA